MSSTDREEVLLQTDRLILSSHFKNSRRYTDMLRYVVRHTLDGQADTLKERTLGIEVFGREPSFDTAGDSIVRVAAAEVRKRLALYYQEEGHEQELRIDLPAGSYVARFRHPQQPMPAVVADQKPLSPSGNPPAADSSTRVNSSIGKRFLLSASTLALLGIAAVATVHFIGQHGKQRDFLGPLWKSSEDAILCIGSPLVIQNQPGINDQASAIAMGQPTANNTLIPLADAITLSRVQHLLSEHRKLSRVQLARVSPFNDLRVGPTILIGAFDNPWTLRLTEKMRFRLVGSDGTQGSIVDTTTKSRQSWTVDFHVPYSDRTQDYGIVAMTHDDTLGQPLLIVAGIGPNGTMAAGEFLINQADLDALWKMAPKNWSGENVEVVLATQVIQDNSGAPQIVAAEFW